MTPRGHNKFLELFFHGYKYFCLHFNEWTCQTMFMNRFSPKNEVSKVFFVISPHLITYVMYQLSWTDKGYNIKLKEVVLYYYPSKLSVPSVP